MKKMRNAALIFAAVLTAAACSKEINSGTPSLSQDGRLVVDAVAGMVGNGSELAKAHGEYGYQVLWDDNDKIAVIDAVGHCGTFSLIKGAGTRTGKFEQSSDDAYVYSGDVAGYYPASILKEDGSIEWPYAQEYAATLTNIPMTAIASIDEGGTVFSFSSIGGVLQLVLTAPQGILPMKSITVSADGLDKPIVLDCRNLTLDTAAKTVNIAVPEGTYSNMQLSFVASDGAQKTMTSSSLSIKKNIVSKVTLAVEGFSRDFPDYLSFTAKGASVPVTMKKFGNPSSYELEFTLDPKAVWTSFKADGGVAGAQEIITLEDGQTVYLRGRYSKTALAVNETNGWSFSFANGDGGLVYARGNIMSLLDPSVKSTTVGEYAFSHLFDGAKELASAPELPAIELGKQCYENMFSNCSNLTAAPDLPAAVLKYRCYYYMFSHSGLRKSARMMAAEMAEWCCSSMYEGCASLESAYTLSAPVLAVQCYGGMFSECTSLVKAPALPATKLCDSCYSDMFVSCTSLVDAPELPATELAMACYSGMFMNCTSLVNAPYLRATKLREYCYYMMFRECKSLKNITVEFSDWNVSFATHDWVKYVPSSGTFRCPAGLPYMTGNSNIPAGWAVAYSSPSSDTAVGTLIYSEGIEGVYVGKDSNGKLLVFATCDYGAADRYENGISMSRASLDEALSASYWGSWQLPSESDINCLVNASKGFLDEFGAGTSAMISGYRYYFPYSNEIAGGFREYRMWYTDADHYYFFKSDNTRGKAAVADTQVHEYKVRLVKRF